MNKTRSCELIWRLIFVCGLGHHPKTPPNTAWPWIGTDSHHWTGINVSKRSQNCWSWNGISPHRSWVKYQSCHWRERVLALRGRYLATPSWNLHNKPWTTTPWNESWDARGPRKSSYPFHSTSIWRMKSLLERMMSTGSNTNSLRPE